MEYKIIEILDKQTWDTYLSEFEYTTLFLSWEWRQFENQQNHKFENYAVYGDETFLGLLPIKYVNARRGKYLHIRHGPLLKEYTPDVIKFLTGWLYKKCQASGSSFFRVSPLISNDAEFAHVFDQLNYKQALTHSTDAELTAVVDLLLTEDQLFSNLRKTTRNLVRKAEKLNLIVKESSDMSLFNDFAVVYTDTVTRNGWNAYSVKYIRDECAVFAKANALTIMISYFEDKPISGAVFIHSGNQVIYHHGGSLRDFRHLPAAYLLHWHAIKFFKSLGFELYNFWGVCPIDEIKHPWFNLSLFKRGYSTHELKFLHALDYIVSPIAHITRFFEFVESKIRGY